MKIEAMKRGDVLVNGTIVSPDYILKGGESLRSTRCHRHGKSVTEKKAVSVDPKLEC
jgi:hypothetical protein